MRLIQVPQARPPIATACIAGALLNRHSPLEIADAIEVLIDLLDIVGRREDPDAPDFSRRSDALAGDPDDTEDDDPAGQCDEDDCNTGDGKFYLHGFGPQGAGCPISDPDVECDQGAVTLPSN